jgi:hypothetical protein
MLEIWLKIWDSNEKHGDFGEFGIHKYDSVQLIFPGQPDSSFYIVIAKVGRHAR